jgi:hypothetical protein
MSIGRAKEGDSSQRHVPSGRVVCVWGGGGWVVRVWWRRNRDQGKGGIGAPALEHAGW